MLDQLTKGLTVQQSTALFVRASLGEVGLWFHPRRGMRRRDGRTMLDSWCMARAASGKYDADDPRTGNRGKEGAQEELPRTGHGTSFRDCYNRII